MNRRESFNVEGVKQRLKEGVDGGIDGDVGYFFAGDGIALAGGAGKVQEAADVIIFVERGKKAGGFIRRELESGKGHRFGDLSSESRVELHDFLEAEHARKFSAHAAR